MTPLTKIAMVIGSQLLVLAAILGFKAYTALDTQTVVLMTRVDEPSTLVSEDGSNVRQVAFAVEYIPRNSSLWDDEAYDDDVYIEIAESAADTWEVVRILGDRDRTRDGTVILRAQREYGRYDPSATDASSTLRVEFRDIYIPSRAASDVPDGDGYRVAVELSVDRFGNATPQRFIIDGEPVALARR